MSPNPPKTDLVYKGDLGMTGDIPQDVTPELIREIPKQDDETHVSGSIEHSGLNITGASFKVIGTFGPKK